LGETAITDEGLKYLADLTELQSLEIRGTKVTNAGLKYLRGLRKLKILHVAGTAVTLSGIEELRRSLPNMKADIEGPLIYRGARKPIDK
jgi:hypothetical protein